MTQHGKAVFHNGVEYKVNFGSANTMRMDIGAEPTTSWTLQVPANPPTGPSTWSIAADGTVTYATLGGGGTVTTFSAGDLTPLFTTTETNPTTTPALTFSLTNQNANVVFAGPTTGVAAAPTFRALVYADISSLVGTAANTIAAGNDTRLHTQNTDTGTTQISFQFDSGNGGPRVKNESGILAVRNRADNAYADLILRNLTVEGTTTTVNSETVTVADNIIELNSNVTTGTPTENLGLRGLRGSSTAASLIFNESTDKWQAGQDTAELTLARVINATFTNATLTAGVLAITHTLDNRYPKVQIYDNNDKIVYPDDITGTSTTALTVDLTSFGVLTGSWKYVLVG